MKLIIIQYSYCISVRARISITVDAETAFLSVRHICRTRLTSNSHLRHHKTRTTVQGN